MIVLIDAEKEFINLYWEKGLKRIHFSDLDEFEEIVGNRQVMYVTSIAEAKASDIVEVVNSLSEQSEQENARDTRDTRRFVHSTKKNRMLVPEIDMMFDHPGICIEITGKFAKKMAASGQVQSLLRSGILEIVNNKEKRRLEKKYFAEAKRKADDQRAREDAAIDRIIVQDNRKAIDVAESGIMGGDDDIAIELDTGSSGVRPRRGSSSDLLPHETGISLMGGEDDG